MTEQLTLRLAWGSCTWTHGSTRISAYVFQETDEGVKRLFPKQVLRPEGRPNYQNAATSGDHGVWTFASYVHQEGALVLVQLNTSRSGSPWCDAARIVRLRADAPLIQIGGKTITAAENNLPTVNCFHGRGDILTPKEANQFGAKLTLNYIEKFLVNRTEIDEAFNVRELLPANAGKPKIETRVIGGEEKVVIQSTRRRRIRLR